MNVANTCITITDYIDEVISRPVEDWEREKRQECKKKKWYDPRRWVCSFVYYVVKIVRWIVVTISKVIVTIVCRAISNFLGFWISILKLQYLLLEALLTWNKCTLQQGLAAAADAIIHFVSIPGIFVDPLVSSVNRYRLQQYVEQEIERRFSSQPDVVQQLKNRFGITSGLFGFRVNCSAHRLFVDSRTRTNMFADVPNLFGLDEKKIISLSELAGFDDGCAIFSKEGWYRPRHQRAKYPFAGGGGLGEPVPPEFTKEDLDAYIKSRGAETWWHFRIYAISPGALQLRLDSAVERARRLGLILTFTVGELEVTEAGHINWSEGGQARFMEQKLHRARIDDMDPNERDRAKAQLCSPATVAVFGFENKEKRGYTNNPIGTTECAAHNLTASHVSGVSFIDDIPDQARRYVLIHELGHHFGLCHVDGFDRIMVSGAEGEGKAITPGAPFGFIVHGGPRFTLDEAKQVWRFILDHFPPECLLGEPFVPHEPPPVFL